jgi:hypothetical protein
MQLALPDLTETEKLMITLKHKSDQRSESRRAERVKLLEEFRAKKADRNKKLIGTALNN